MVKENGVEVTPKYSDDVFNKEMRRCLYQTIDNKRETQVSAFFSALTYFNRRKKFHESIVSLDDRDITQYNVKSLERRKPFLEQWEAWFSVVDLPDRPKPYSTTVSDEDLEDDVRAMLWQFHFESSVVAKEKIVNDLLTYIQNIRDNRPVVRPAKRKLS